ncbi:hypothetical protein LTS10_003116 [Elasticomyces elasticus]|nr:hypothetical protein LTS10_003116 [Elasticomyces elasticus]
MELLTSRVLAQQLYSRCRESADAYKPFSLSLKRLRNVLEDIEDGVEDSTTSESYNARLNEQVERCHGILIQLDAAMRPQQDVDGLQSPSADAVLDLKTAIDVACHQLSVAYEAPSNLGSNIGGLQLRLQTSAGSPTTSSHAKSASTSATSYDTRKLSTSSSTWSLVKPESSTGESIVYVTSAATSPALTPMHEEEKQVCSSSGGLAPARSPSAWASTFALDPLSIPMDEASAFILSDDSPTASDRTYLSPTRPWSASITTPSSDAKEAEVLTTIDNAEREHPAHSVTGQSQGLGITLKDPVHPERNDAVEMHNGVISKTTSTPYTPANPTASSSSFGDIDGSFSTTLDKTTLSSAKTDKDQKTAPTPPARAPPPPPPSPKRPRNTSISRYVITNTTPLDDEVTDDSDDETTPAPTVQAPVPTEDIQIGYVALRSPSDSIPEVRVDDSACEAIPPDQHQSPNSHIAWASASLEQALTTPSEKEVLSNHSLTNTTNAKPPPLPQRPRRHKTVHSTQSASLSVLDSFITQALVDLEGNDRSKTDRCKDHKLKQRKSVSDALNVCPPATKDSSSTRRWSWQRRSRSRSELDHTQMPAPPQRQTSYSGSASPGLRSELEERSAKPLPPFPPPQRQRSHSGLAQLIRDEQASRAPAPVVPQRQRSHSGLAQLIRQDGRSAGLGMRPFMRSSGDLERDTPPPIPPRPAART